MVWKVFEGKWLSPEINSLEDDNVTAGTGSLPAPEQGTHGPVLVFEASVRRLIFQRGRQEPKGMQGREGQSSSGCRLPGSSHYEWAQRAHTSTARKQSQSGVVS